MPITRSQAARHTRIPLAGGTQETLLSEVGPVLLRFVSSRDACALRLVCREFLAAVSEHPWEDRRTVIKGSIGAWRACFPRARCANVQKWGPKKRDAPVVDADFVHFEGLRELNMTSCRDVTDAAFVHLRGIRTLDMSFCWQPAITDASIAHLAGIQRLSIWGCYQATITDAAFAHLRSIQLLNMSYCRQLTDTAFVHLRGIHTLYMRYCRQPAITDAAFAHLRGIHTLVIDHCSQATITGTTLAFLKGVSLLGMFSCNEALIASAQDLGLPVSRMRAGISCLRSPRGHSHAPYHENHAAQPGYLRCRLQKAQLLPRHRQGSTFFAACHCLCTCLCTKENKERSPSPTQSHTQRSPILHEPLPHCPPRQLTAARGAWRGCGWSACSARWRRRCSPAPRRQRGARQCASACGA